MWCFPFVTDHSLCDDLIYACPSHKAPSSLRAGTLSCEVRHCWCLAPCLPRQRRSVENGRINTSVNSFIPPTCIEMLRGAGARGPSAHRPLRGFSQVMEPQEGVTSRACVQSCGSGEDGVCGSSMGLAAVSEEDHTDAESSSYCAIYISRYQTATYPA